MDMDEEVAAWLPLPKKEVVLDYARRAVAAAERTVNAIDTGHFLTTYKSPVDWEARASSDRGVVGYRIHDEFHRGQIAALRRAQNLPRVRR